MIRIKTVKFAFPTYTDIMTNNTLTNLSQITVYIPEASPTFLSATVDIGFHDVITATGGTITNHSVGLRLGAAGYSTFSETDDIAHTGESLGGVIGPIDFTSYFNTNWTGTSMTCDVQTLFNQSTGTTLGMRNVTAELTITYQYDDTAATQIKTVHIPLESLTSPLSTTANSNIGSHQIPILTGGSGMLVENSPVIRDYYFLIEGNVAINNITSDFTVTCNIDSGSSFSFGITEAQLGSDYYARLIYKPSVPTTTSTHNFQMWSSLASKMNHLSITLVVTYEFTLSGTTQILNSLILPLELSSPLGINTSAEASRFSRQFFVQESNVTLRQSAFKIHFNTTAAVAGLNWRAGGQAYRTYSHLGNTVCGMYTLQQRIDSGSAQGPGFTLSRGVNTITIDGYATDTIDQVNNISGYTLINYTSDIPSGGVGQANHTIEVMMSEWNAQLLDRIRINDYAVSIPEAAYWLVAFGFYVNLWNNVATNGVTFDVECLSGEGKGGGYYDIYADVMQTDAERGNTLIYMRGRDVFKRNPNDPDNERLDVEIARDYRWYSSAPVAVGIACIFTMHSFTYTTTLNITGSNGGTVNVDVYRVDTGEKILSTSRVGNGSVDLTWYDNTVDVFAVCREDDTLVARSGNFKIGD